MKTTKYIGIFISEEGRKYSLRVNCYGFIQAFFLLTADAIRRGEHYQLSTITDEHNKKVKVKNILAVNQLMEIA